MHKMSGLGIITLSLSQLGVLATWMYDSIFELCFGDCLGNPPTKKELSFVSCQVVFYATLLAVGLFVRALCL